MYGSACAVGRGPWRDSLCLVLLHVPTALRKDGRLEVLYVHARSSNLKPELLLTYMLVDYIIVYIWIFFSEFL
jgi:hypothetical protein